MWFADLLRGDASCALGAAYEGMHRLPAEAEGVRPRDLWRLFDCLENTLRRCPAGSDDPAPERRPPLEPRAHRGLGGAGAGPRTAGLRRRLSGPARRRSR